ncbi:UPF0721 transmembrane protein [Agaricicola taiwanensis]|uniref:Probable membrane transporter protein n=1 Tax=Agaricicola taiwanensis TaxID=591372 RepID=A0A8J2VLI4_9RHOB|nr:sulfite exporter TauE/SafE family protein [Agaricicola taiwanensis]GGE31438.1 UPF0721 transmembrane protein [Agaricicola taiwanensis]
MFPCHFPTGPDVLVYLPIAEIPVNVLLVLGMSLAVGFVSGMFGIGGGFLMTPLLIFSGVPTAIAVATEASQIAAASVTGSIAYWRRKALDLKLAGVLLIGGIAGTGLGVVFVRVLSRLGQLDLVIAVSYVVFLGIVGGLMLVESARAILRTRRGIQVKRRSGQHNWIHGLPLKMRFKRSMIYVSVIPLIGLGVFIGFVGAVLGIGGGFILVPALVYLFRVPTNVVVGTSLFQILITMLVATVLHAGTNQAVDAVLALMLMIGGSIGAQFGARAGQKLRGEHLRFLLAALLLAVGARFAIDLITTPEEPFSYSVRGEVV